MATNRRIDRVAGAKDHPVVARTENNRSVRGTVDGHGIYSSRVVAAGPYVFMAGTATDDNGRLDPQAQPKPPYHNSPSANAREQTRSIFDHFRRELHELGSSLDDVLQVEQIVERKVHADGYLETSRGPGCFERRRPASLLVATGRMLPAGCVVNPSGIAVIPGDGITKEILLPDPNSSALSWSTVSGGAAGFAELGESYTELPYNELLTAGSYVFTEGECALKYGVGLHPDAKAPDWIWWGNEIRNEVQLSLEVEQGILSRAGTSLDNAVRCTVYMTDLSDLYELDLVWKRYFPTNPPARTVLPVAGLGSPRREGVRGHGEGAMKYEAMTQAIRPGYGVTKEIVDSGRDPLSHQSDAVRAGALLWISAQFAVGPDGVATAPDTRSQVDEAFVRLDSICRAGGTQLANLVQLRAFVTDLQDGYAVYTALKSAVPSNPPCVVISEVPGPLQYPGCTVMIDGVAHVP
jgi:enamine deaminase RidA (YjgF/YER057c/UK114 family)